MELLYEAIGMFFFFYCESGYESKFVGIVWCVVGMITLEQLVNFLC